LRRDRQDAKTPKDGLDDRAEHDALDSPDIFTEAPAEKAVDFDRCIDEREAIYRLLRPALFLASWRLGDLSVLPAPFRPRAMIRNPRRQARCALDHPRVRRRGIAFHLGRRDRDRNGDCFLPVGVNGARSQ